MIKYDGKKYPFISLVLTAILISATLVIAMFMGKEIKKCQNKLIVKEQQASKRIKVEATAYCPCKKCCGKFADGVTATGRDASKAGVAVDPKVIPLGSHIDIPGYGNWILADDVGGAIKGNRIDVRFSSHQDALNWGRREIIIRVWPKKEK